MDVFVYGTLTDPDRVDAVLDAYHLRDDRWLLSGLRRVAGRYPTLVPNGETHGRLLTTPEMDRLDAYEGVDRGLYVRVTVPRADGGEVAVYVGDPDRLAVEELAQWPAGGSFADRVRRYVETFDVSVERVPGDPPIRSE